MIYALAGVDFEGMAESFRALADVGRVSGRDLRKVRSALVQLRRVAGRPSRGWRRHLRRAKAANLIQGSPLAGTVRMLAREVQASRLDRETLALIEEHRLRLRPIADGWKAEEEKPVYLAAVSGAGPTIGDAVRACVARIKAGS